MAAIGNQYDGIDSRAGTDHGENVMQDADSIGRDDEVEIRLQREDQVGVGLRQAQG
jgi:hypothetical protein